MVHFAVLGGLIFAIAPAGASSRRVSISRTYLESLRAVQAERLGVQALSDGGRAEVDQRAIEDEVLYREALRLGIDRDDSIVRQHLIQKTLVLAEDLAGASREPSPADVRDYFEKHESAFRHARQVHFIHVFASSSETLLALVERVRVEESSHPGTPPPLGDAFPRSRDVRGGDRDIAATFGEPFAEAVFQQPVGSWSAPIGSRYGWHLVKVLEVDEGRPETFAEAEGRARLELAVERRHVAIAQFIKRAMERYDVDIDGSKVTGTPTTPRLAMRASPSAED